MIMAAIKIVASYAEDQVVTTNPQQLLEIEQAKKQYEQELLEAQAGGEAPPAGDQAAGEGNPADQGGQLYHQ